MSTEIKLVTTIGTYKFALQCHARRLLNGKVAIAGENHEIDSIRPRKVCFSDFSALLVALLHKPISTHCQLSVFRTVVVSMPLKLAEPWPLCADVQLGCFI